MSFHRIFRRVVDLPGAVAIFIIRVYQWALSPMKAALFGQAATCRFFPTCSQYALEAIRLRGLCCGMVLAVVRLAKCHPFHPGGFDPVPHKCGDDGFTEEREEEDLPLDQRKHG